MAKKFLVIAPHVDDEAIGCGGSILKHKARGDVVDILYMHCGYEHEARQREEEAERACNFMRVDGYHFFDFEAEDYGTQEVGLIELLRRINPDILYTPHGDEGDPDHKKVHNLTMGAIWKANGAHFPHISGRSNIRGVLQYEVHTPILSPNYLEDISEFVDIKRKLIALYQSQLAITPYGEGILGLNRYRAVFKEFGDYVEAFNLKSFRNMFD